VDKEKGYSVCSGGKVIALVHNHPSGNIAASKKDMETAKTHNVKVCVIAGDRVKCYKARGR
jgi:proteasome lid subunit RPN8/RPN11